jgi:Ca-activated chloride channel homolog
MPTGLANPIWLLGLVLPALLAAWSLIRRPHIVVLPLDHSTVKSSVWLGRMVRMAALLPALLLAVAIVLLASPTRAGRPSAERVMTNIQFVLDLSGSMTESFGTGTRYDASIAALEKFTTHRRGDAFGLTVFGNEVLHWTPLTKDLDAIRTAAPFLRPEDMPAQFGGTEIGKALRAAFEQVRSRGAEGGMIVLVSDGISADLWGSAPQQIGSEFAAAGVVLYSIHIGGEQTPSPLFELVRPTGGQVFHAQDAGALAAVFADIDRLQPIRMRPTAPRPIDAFLLPAGLGLAVLGFYLLTLLGLRATPW